jgi:hypothetical protein
MPKARVRLPSTEKRQWYYVLGILAFGALVMLGLLLVQAGPRFSWKTIAFWDTGEDPEIVLALQQRSLEAEEAFRGRIIVGVPTDEDLRPLREAIALQREFIDRTKTPDTRNLIRLDQLETLLAEAEAKQLLVEIERAEASARESEAAGDLAGARAAFQRALDAQRRVNSSRAAGVRNSQREAMLARSLQNLEARPLGEQSLEAEAAARALVAKDKWTEALEEFRKAYDLQLRINREFPNSGFVNSVRLERLDIEISSFATGGLIQEIQRMLERGHEAMEGARYSEAALAFRGALERQLRVNAEFPRSRLASRDRAEEYRVLVETAESAPTALRLREQDGIIAESLRNQRIEPARQALQQATDALNAIQTQFRRSTLVDDVTKFRIAYLTQVQDDIVSIQRAVLANLRPIPGHSLEMLATEVPQSIYRRVMQGNPSRNIGDQFPVESVSFDEAVEFCRRLGWILGRPVRLPGIEEFKAGVGRVEIDALADGRAWIGENSGNTSQLVGSSLPSEHGFHDLLGNVAEWLGTPDVVAGTAKVGGGSYVDRASAFIEFPIASRPRNDRSRTVGFRFVVEPKTEGSGG